MKLKVKEVCKEQGITIQDLADKIGVKRESLSRAINGNPTLETIEKIANALNVSVNDLFVQSASDKLKITCPHCGKDIEITIK